MTGAVISLLRETVPGPGSDRFMSPELAQTVELVTSGAVLTAASELGTFEHSLADVDGTVLTGVS